MATARAQEDEQSLPLEWSRCALNADVTSYTGCLCVELFQQHKGFLLEINKAALHVGLLAAVSALPMRNLMARIYRCYQVVLSSGLYLAFGPCQRGNSQMSFSTYRKQQFHAPRNLFAGEILSNSNAASYRPKSGTRLCAMLRELISQIVAQFSSSRRTLIAHV